MFIFIFPIVFPMYDMCELCHQNKFVFVYFKSFGDCVDKQLKSDSGWLRTGWNFVMACNILRYFKLNCIMYWKVYKKLKWSFLTFFEFPFQYIQNGIIIITLTNLFIVDHDLIRFTQYIHVHYTSLRETRPYNFFHLKPSSGTITNISNIYLLM